MTFLVECVTDDMSSSEAAKAVEDCWDRAKILLAPVLGNQGLSVLFREGENAAARHLALSSPPGADRSIKSFATWVRALKQTEALVVCKAFLESVERYLISLVGVERARRMMERAPEMTLQPR